MRGSDRRHLKARLAECFPVLTPEVMDDILPNKLTVNVMKLTTHSGDDVLVYLLESQPLFFELNERLYPSVYILWSLPELIPSLSTWSPVFEKLSNGADLMLPGVVIPYEGLPELVRNRPCSVNLEGNAAAMAVGSTVMSNTDMISCGMKGKGINVKHCFGDHLWKVGDKSTPPHIPVKGQADQEPTESQTEASAETNLIKEDNDDNSSLENKEAPNLEAEASENANQLAKDAKGEEIEEESLSPVDQMDALLYQCLLHCLKTKVKPSSLPMTTIILYRTHMRAVCPPNLNLDVRKSSYKKLNKFLSFAQNKGLVEVKETSKGVDSLVSFDGRHDDLLNFQIPDNIFSDDSKEERKFHIPQEVNPDQHGRQLEGTLHQMYQVTADMSRILEPMGHRKGAWLKPEEVRSAVTEYIKNNDLVDPLNRSHVQLGPHLHDAIMEKSEGHITQLPWDQVFTRCFAKMSSGYQMLSSDQESSRPVIKGKLKPISLKIERKAGNKLMTVIQNLDPYGIDIKEFAHKLQVGVAASATISQGQGQKAGQEVRVQGNQINYLSKLLIEDYKIPRRYLQGLDLAPKNKKR